MGWSTLRRPDGTADPCQHRAHAGESPPPEGGYILGLNVWVCSKHLPPEAEADVMTFRQAQRTSLEWEKWRRSVTQPVCLTCGQVMAWTRKGSSCQTCSNDGTAEQAPALPSKATKAGAFGAITHARPKRQRPKEHPCFAPGGAEQAAEQVSN